MKVARCTPMYFLPYIDFSTQVPQASATAWSSDKPTVLAAHEVGYPTPALTLLGEAEYAGGYIDEGSETAEDAATMHSASAYANEAYGRVYEDPDSGTHWLDYWYYYYDDSQTVAGIRDHEGDWETMPSA